MILPKPWIGPDGDRLPQELFSGTDASGSAKHVAISIASLAWLLATFLWCRSQLRDSAAQQKKQEDDVAAAHAAVLTILQSSQKEGRSFRSPALRAAAWKELHRFSSVGGTGNCDHDRNRHFGEVTWQRVLQRLERDAAGDGEVHVRRVKRFDVRTGREEISWRWAPGCCEEKGEEEGELLQNGNGGGC